MRLLSKICKTHRIVPASYVLQQELTRVGVACNRGGFAEVSDGEYLGSRVAIKRLKTNEWDTDESFKVLSISPRNTIDRSAFTQWFCREIICWKHLSHPNILPLIGVSVSPDLRCLRILTEWMPCGDVTKYTKSNPNANRLRLVSPFAVSPLFSLSSTL